MSDVGLTILGLCLIVSCGVVASAWRDVAARLESAATILARAVERRWLLEFEVEDSPRAVRERTPAPPPSEDPRLAPFDEWLRAWTAGGAPAIEPRNLEHLRACYAIVVGVKKCRDPGRFAAARAQVEAYGCPVPADVSSGAA